MRIVITRLGNCLSLDGINVFIYELSEALIQLGHEVYLISSIASTFPLGGNANANTASVNKTVRERFSVIEVPNIISLHSSFHGKRTFFHYLEGNFFFISKGSWIINDLHPDMMILNGTTSFCPFFKVAVCHDLQFRAKFHKYYNLIMYHTIDKIVAPSSELGQEIKRQLHLSAKRIVLIPICINTDIFQSHSKSKRIHAILHVGLRREKRPDKTIDAFAMIAKNDRDIRLLIAGQTAPGESIYESQLKKQEKHIRDRITIHENISKKELVDLYSHVKATSVPSDYRFPVCSPTVIESLAAGTPVVGSLSAISQDILIDGYSGFRVPFSDNLMLASKLQILISNELLWNRMSSNCLKLARRFDKKRVAHDYLSLYQAHVNQKLRIQ